VSKFGFQPLLEVLLVNGNSLPKMPNQLCLLMFYWITNSAALLKLVVVMAEEMLIITNLCSWGLVGTSTKNANHHT
jgi:hypothetical protein